MTTIKYVYIGQGGEHHSGIPARNLSDDDWAGLTAEQKATVANSPLYKPARQKAAAKKDGE